jgi:hypothetical protein
MEVRASQLALFLFVRGGWADNASVVVLMRQDWASLPSEKCIGSGIKVANYTNKEMLGWSDRDIGDIAPFIRDGLTQRF